MSYIKMDNKMNLECSHPLVKKVFFNGNASLYDPKFYLGLTVCLEEGNKEFVKTFIDDYPTTTTSEINLVKKANEFLEKEGWINK